MNSEFVGAVTALVDALIFRDCIDVSGCDEGSIVIIQDCVEAVLKSIHAMPEFAELHDWADRRLAHDYGDPAEYEAAQYLSDKHIQAAREHIQAVREFMTQGESERSRT